MMMRLRFPAARTSPSSLPFSLSSLVKRGGGEEGKEEGGDDDDDDDDEGR